VNQRFSDEHAAKLAEMASFIRQVIHGVTLLSVPGGFARSPRQLNHSASAARTARTNAAIRA
jgi:hypothetical protein